MTPIKDGDEVRVVEHDDSTRQPKPGGDVLQAKVVKVSEAYVFVRLGDGESDAFWRETGWRAWDGEMRWRLELPAGKDTR